MQTPIKAVRYYIDREADTPVIRSVPVSRPNAEPDTVPHTAEQHAATELHRHNARRRLTTMVQASVRKHRHHAS